ncbi:MAG: hypothetical protein AB8B53_07405 [Flavobacteriales bacterium]
MKNTLFLIGIVIICASCEKVDQLSQFEMEFKESFTIEAGTPLDLPFTLATPEINTDYQSVYEQYDTRADRIEEINLKEIEFTISSPSSGTFNFLESVSMSISSEGEEAQSIAEKTDIPNDQSTALSLETSEVNLKDYLSVDRFTLSASTVCDELLTEDYTIDVRCIFFVDARVLGQ